MEISQIPQTKLIILILHKALHLATLPVPSCFSQLYYAQRWLCYFSHANLKASPCSWVLLLIQRSKAPITELVLRCQASAYASPLPRLPSPLFATWSTHPSQLGSGVRRACPWPSTVCPLVAALIGTYHLLGCPDSPRPDTFLRAGSRTSSLGVWEFNKALQNEGETLKAFILYKL